ncbi:MAG TPA: hypothetical protein VGT08_18980 [Terracidiphilus sp.]|nr:hypothetical protein [Terracidiphilus sp.]
MASIRNRNRDAHATFAGFIFQVNVTIFVGSVCYPASISNWKPEKTST